MKMEEILELIKTGKNDLLEQKLNDNPSLADSKTEQGISLLQFAAFLKCQQRNCFCNKPRIVKEKSLVLFCCQQVKGCHLTSVSGGHFYLSL